MYIVLWTNRKCHSIPVMPYMVKLTIPSLAAATGYKRSTCTVSILTIAVTISSQTLSVQPLEMKFFPLLCLLVREGTSTHLETCECHEISELVNASVQQAAARLEYKLGIMIDTALSNINTTISNINTTVYTAISNTTDETALSNLESRLTSAIQGLLKPIQNQLDYHLPLPTKGKTADDPATSCKNLHDTYYALSGYYWIGEVGSVVEVYCNMSLTCGNLTGGWMRVANIDMTNTLKNCPGRLNLTSSPIPLCHTTTRAGCESNNFNVHGAQYSHICGRVIGYQNTSPAAFYYHSSGIDGNYVYGVSLTHGQNPRQHIWTFAAALDESSSNYRYKCPCTNTNLLLTPSLPSYIGNDYFCDTAFRSTASNILEVTDPLWDGEGCGPTSTCCYDPDRKVNPPWFVKTLSSPTSDNIEMRLCTPVGRDTTPIEIVEIYVQ